MGNLINDNFILSTGKPLDSRYLDSLNKPYESVTVVNSIIPITKRYIGLTVLISGLTNNVEYWWKDNLYDSGLVEKNVGSGEIIGDLVSGGTNLGVFLGKTGVQKLTLSGFSTDYFQYDGDYYSTYNNYYVGDGGKVLIGLTSRAYVLGDKSVSWIFNYSFNTPQWYFVIGDITTMVGTTVADWDYPDGTYINETWDNGFYYDNDSSINVSGSLVTGNTLTIGNPIYKDIVNNKLNFRSIINDSPTNLNISYDDNYIRFSGSSMIDGISLGSGNNIFTGHTNSIMGFRSLKSSGDTTITQDSDGSLIIYSSSNGSADASTGVTSMGVGVSVFDKIVNRNVQLKSLVGSGGVIISNTDDEITIHSPISVGAFEEDIVVSIDPSKSFGKFLNGDTIPSNGLTANEVIKLACFEAKAPILTLSSTNDILGFGLTNKVVNLNFSNVIMSLNAVVDSVLLEFSIEGEGDYWEELPILNTDTSYSHNINTIDGLSNEMAYKFKYRYTVTDTSGGTNVINYDVDFDSYMPPIVDISLNGVISGDETQYIREKGNVVSSPSFTITSNHSNINITGWELLKSVNGSELELIESSDEDFIESVNVVIAPILDDTVPTNATTIEYCVRYYDSFTYDEVITDSITFKYYSFIGVSELDVLDSSGVTVLGNKSFRSSQDIIHTFSTQENEYAYYAYPQLYDSIGSILMLDNGVGTPSSIMGVFNMIDTIMVTNSYNVGGVYRIYRSNAYGAFSNDVITFG